MAKKILSTIIGFCLTISATGELTAQAKITGHVFAEVVAPPPISLQTNDKCFYYKKDSTNSALELGEIHTKVAIAIKTYSQGVRDNTGKNYPFKVVSLKNTNETPNKNEMLVYKLKGTPDKNLWMKKKRLYSGYYQTVLIYN